MASAIAFAEGFNVQGSAPNRAHNPGDFKLGDLGWGVTGAEGVTVFPDEETGWSVLYHELRLIANHAVPGSTDVSHVYTLATTVLQMATRWTDTASLAWATNVAEWYRRHGRTIAVNQPLSLLLVDAAAT